MRKGRRDAVDGWSSRGRERERVTKTANSRARVVTKASRGTSKVRCIDTGRYHVSGRRPDTPGWGRIRLLLNRQACFRRRSELESVDYQKSCISINIDTNS